jgi:hypothetical protein
MRINTALSPHFSVPRGLLDDLGVVVISSARSAQPSEGRVEAA